MIACISIPYFASNVERRYDSRLKRQPLVLGGQPWEPRPVYAYSGEVAHQGVRPGMLLRQAHLISPDACFMPAIPDQYEHVAIEVAEVLLDFSHLLESDYLWQAAVHPQTYTANQQRLPSRYYLDVTGLPHAEIALFAKEMGRTVREQTKLAPAIGVASHKFAAAIAATTTLANHARTIDPDTEERFLNAQPVEFLPLPAEVNRRLRLLGLHTIGHLQNIPSHQIQTQFGKLLVEALKHASGKHKVSHHYWSPEHVEKIERQFDPPISDNTIVYQLIYQMATELAGRLQRTSQQAQQVQLTCHFDSDDRQTAHHILRRPTDDVIKINRIAIQIYQSAITQPEQQSIVALSLAISDCQPSAMRQLTLFEFGRTQTAPESASLDLTHLISKYGRQIFQQITANHIDDPLPENRYLLTSVLSR